MKIPENIEKTKPYVPGKPIEEVQRELGLKRVIKLASNENCLGPSPKALKAARKALSNINRYPDASCFYLKKKLASFLGVCEENIMMGNGSDECIVVAIRTFMEPGDEVIIARPTFLIYEIAAQIHYGKMKFVPLTSDLRYDLKAMKKAITSDTKMVFIANPDNPTGTYVTKKELEEFFKGLPEHVIVYLDEAYFEFADFSRKDYPNGLVYLTRPNTIIGRSFSKVYGLAGLRIGYAVSNPTLISYMERVRDPFNVNLVAQEAAIAALDDKEFLKKSLMHTEEEKAFLCAAIKDMGLEYVPSATNFMLVNVRKDCKDVFKALLQKGIIVRDMKAWGLDTYIRVTVGLRKENEMFIGALREVLKGA